MTLTFGDRALRPDEVPPNLRHHLAPTPEVPSYTIPRYQTGGQLFTRDELIDLFRQTWPDYHVNAGDVHNYLMAYFGEKGRSKSRVIPTGTIPFPPMPDIDEDVDDRTRSQLIQGHENQRINTRRSRELFKIDGLPKFVPSFAKPSMNDEPHIARRKAERIANA